MRNLQNSMRNITAQEWKRYLGRINYVFVLTSIILAISDSFDKTSIKNSGGDCIDQGFHLSCNPNPANITACIGVCNNYLVAMNSNNILTDFTILSGCLMLTSFAGHAIMEKRFPSRPAATPTPASGNQGYSDRPLTNLSNFLQSGGGCC